MPRGRGRRARHEPAGRQEPAGNVRRQPARNARQQPAEGARQEPAGNVRRQPARNVRQEPAEMARQEPLGNARQPARNARRGLAGEVRQDPADNARHQAEARGEPADHRNGGRGRKRTADELEGLVEDRMLQDNADVWILGDSIPYWAGSHATAAGKPNLNITGLSIAWWGKRGLGWSGLRQHIETQVLLSTPPRIIIVNLGGNDLLTIKTPEIGNIIRQEIIYLRDAFPNTIIIWLDILPRQIWSGSRGGNAPIDAKRKRLNRIGRKIVSESGNSDIITTEIDSKTAFYRPDGVHLNLVGLEFYLDFIKDAILRNMY
ncbi:uncharacterized protein LOC128549419 [Mercenaria mercenaria]|uniref:uncharacterized protein LOC128549419 n=1 Tax=Mercenaria mercenaria TaxID=6596 RepID=UPI00234FA252|nr:uncharacterized protein LOC128549419 [Mercenaria mercenaria]